MEDFYLAGIPKWNKQNFGSHKPNRPLHQTYDNGTVLAIKVQCSAIAQENVKSLQHLIEEAQSRPSRQGIGLCLLHAMAKKHRQLWLCLKGHPPFKVRCDSRSSRNTGCPGCGAEGSRMTRHPPLSERPGFEGIGACQERWTA